MKQRITRVDLDLDDTIVDLTMGLIHLFGKGPTRDIYRKDNPYYKIKSQDNQLFKVCDRDNDPKVFWEDVHRRGGVPFWTNLEMTSSGSSIVQMLEALERELPDFTFQIVTSLVGPEHSECRDSSLAGKWRWAENNDLGDRLTITTRKSAHAHAGSLLVDDNPEYVRDYMKSGGRAALFPRPWNQDESFARSVVRLGYGTVPATEQLKEFILKSWD